MNKLSIGVVGCGSIGIVHIANFLRMTDVKEVSVYDISPEMLKKVSKLHNVRIFLDYRQFLEYVDAVCIATPNVLHYQQTLDALRFNKHVIVEKPLATTSTEAWELVKEAEKRELVLAVGNQKRFNPNYLMLKEKFKTGMIGKPVLIKARMIGGGPYRVHKAATYWYYNKLKGGGALFDFGAHMVDLVLWINPFSKFKVLGVNLGRILQLPVEEYAFCLLKTNSNVSISIEVGWFTNYHEESLEIVGTMDQLIAKENLTLKRWILSKFGHKYYRNSDYFWQDLAFIKSCLMGSHIGCLATGKEGAQCVSVIEEIYKYSKQ